MVLYVLTEGLEPYEALYLTISTLTTLGYGDITPVTTWGRAVTMVASVGGLLIVFGIGVEIVQESLQQTLEGRNRRMQSQIAAIRNHHIVCGYGTLGERVVEQFLRLGQKFVVVEREAAVANTAVSRGLLVVEGDAHVQETLSRAGIDRAKSVIATFPGDADNVYLVLECRELRRDIDVLCIASSRDAARRMYLAGATRVVSPAAVAAEMVAKSAVNPSVIQLMSEVTDATSLGENLTQIVVAPGSKLCGRALRDLSDLGVNVKVVAAKVGDSLSLPQSGEFRIEPGMLLVVAGTVDELDKLEDLSQPPPGSR